MKIHISDELTHGLLFVAVIGGIFGAMCGILYLLLRYMGYDLTVNIERVQQCLAEML